MSEGVLLITSRGHVNRVIDNGYLKFQRSQSNTYNFDKITVSDTVIKFNEANTYDVVFNSFPQGCPYKDFMMEAEIADESGYLDVEIDNKKDYIRVYGVFPKNTTLRLKTSTENLRYYNQLEIKGVIKISDVRYRADVILERVRNTNVMYYSNRPQVGALIPLTPMDSPNDNPLVPEQHPNATDVYPWSLSIIPHKPNQPLPDGPDVIVEPPLPVPPSAIDTHKDAFGKFRSIPDSIAFYLGNDSTEDKINRSIFAKDYDHRGYAKVSENEWENGNYLKKQYVSSLSSDKLQFYDRKVKDFVNVAYADVVINRLPFVSSFKKNVILFFLDVHIGKHEYPEYVTEYFEGFTNLIGVGNPNDEQVVNLLLKGNHNFQKVFDYFEEKLTTIIDNKDKTCIAYWFAQSGFPRRTLVAECIHNVVAFSQFANTFYSIIYTSINPSNPLSENLPDYPNFLELFKNADSENEKLNIVREAFRLTVPNGVSFSTYGDDTSVQTRHNHLEIMVQNNPGINAGQKQYSYFTYKPNMYNEFVGNFDDIYDVEVVPDFLDAVKTSKLDQETIVDADSNLVPIFGRPIYTPFGLGYRRCAGEIFSYLIVQRLMEKFSLCDYEIRDGDHDIVYVAPSKGVPDNIYVVL